jgi:hypothetical protein
MSKPTLLELVQDILSDADGDEVNSIGETIESMQVARVVRNCYRAIVEEFDLQGEECAFQLEASTSATRPTHMTIPANIFDVSMVRYAKKEVPYVTPADFLEKTETRDLTESHHVEVTDPTLLKLVLRNNAPPRFWTSFDGARSIVFDSWEESVDGVMQTSKTECLGKRKRELVLEDSSEVELPDTLHAFLYNEAREMYFELYKDGAPRKVNEAARRSRVRAKERRNKIATPHDTLPDYGRKRRG